MNKVNEVIAQWHNEIPGLDLLPMSVIGHLGLATRLVSRDYLDPFFKEHSLHQGEFDVLATLRRSGAPYRLAPTQLFEALMISSGGMTNRLDRLEKSGLILREANPEDRRSMLVALSDKGLDLINQMVQLHVENEAKALKALSNKEQQTLEKLLEKLVNGLDGN